jgi:hypothetical protein
VGFKGIVAAIGVVVTVTVADLAGQNRRVPQPTAAERRALVQLFDALDRGQAISLLDRGQAISLTIRRLLDFHAVFQAAANEWTNAAPEPDRARRRQVVAVAVLEAARGAATGEDLTIPLVSWASVRKLIEWQCDQLRRGAPTEFERRWMVASAAVIRVAGDSRFMTGSSVSPDIRVTFVDGRPMATRDVPCKTAELEPCNHADHIESRFPGDPEVALARVTVETGTLARQPGRLAGTIARSKLAATSRVGPVNPGLAEVIDAGLAELRRLADDGTVGWDARLRLGLTLYGLNQRAESLRELAIVAASPIGTIPRYFAHFASALIHEADNNAAGTIASLEAAQAIVPHVRSTATLLAAKYVIADRREDGFALMDEVYLAEPPAFDPLRQRLWTWSLTRPFERLRETIRP